MSKELPDTQASNSEIEVGLNRVGVTGVEKIVRLSNNGSRDTVLTATFDVYVNLPRWRKGIDMSRNMEVVDEILEEAIDTKSADVESLCSNVAERLLERHGYTSYAEVQMEAQYGTKEQTPASNKTTQSTETILASAGATEDGLQTETGVRVTGMTVCPCSQGMSEKRAEEVLEDLDVDEETREEFLDRVPQPGHSQRGYATLKVESTDEATVDVDELIELARDSMSARIYNLAKRPDEDHMTYNGHANAKFVEDCVRSMAVNVVERLDLDDNVVVTMKQSNDESIHQHNAHAERCATYGQLASEVGDTSAEEAGEEGSEE